VSAQPNKKAYSKKEKNKALEAKMNELSEYEKLARK